MEIMVLPLKHNRLCQSFAKRADSLLRLFGVSDRIPVATHARSHRQWMSDGGDARFRFEYELDESDVVFDVGGYRGDWAAEIHEKFGCQIHVFEPVPEYCQLIKDRFAGLANVDVHDFGLAGQDEEISLCISDDSTSQFISASETTSCKLRSVQDFLREQQIDRVALLKLNIEGGEYDLLGSLIASDLITKFANLQVQFHWFVPDSRNRMREIQNALQRTHVSTYQYPYVWENWSRAA
ncbi:MAG: FkbM family methyltransferase [Rubripirellula sp.]|nr:FkbM family methyltransferase [Planctomycetaceae bacterium]MDF1842387.1 FkbM family methyltransferase [Rubripirellula sp.]